jgi:hypothetical protein
MKTMAIVVGGLLLAFAAGCGGDDQAESGASDAEAKAAYCSSLSELEDAVSGIKDLSLQSSLDEVRAVGDEISSAWDDVEKSAEELKDVRIDEQLDAAVNDFTEAIGDIPSSATLSDAFVEIVQSGAAVVRGAASQIGSTITCD